MVKTALKKKVHGTGAAKRDERSRTEESRRFTDMRELKSCREHVKLLKKPQAITTEIDLNLSIWKMGSKVMLTFIESIETGAWKTIDKVQDPTNTEKFFSMSSISAFSVPKKTNVTSVWRWKMLSLK